MRLSAGELRIEDGGLIVAGSVDEGDGSPVEINVEGLVSLSGNSRNGQASSIFTNSESRAAEAGDASRLDIKIRAQALHLSDGTRIVADTAGAGAGGEIVIDTQQLSLQEGSSISTNTFGKGTAGTLFIRTGKLNMAGVNSKGIGSAISSSSTGHGAGGLVDIQADSLKLEDGGQIGTNAFDQGVGGDAHLNIRDTAEFSGFDERNFVSGIFSTSQGEGSKAGDAGNIQLSAGTLRLSNTATITAGTSGTGHGGNVTVHTDTLHMDSGSVINASSIGFGDAGNLNLVLENRLLMNNSNIQTSTASADGGNLAINGHGYVHLIDSNVSTSVLAEDGNGGNIRLNSLFVLQQSSPIIARAVGGDGGNIDISTKGVFQFYPRTSSPIDASSRFGLDGMVEIRTPGTDPSGSLETLPSTFDKSRLQTSQCSIDSAHDDSRLVIRRRAGVPLAEDDLQAVELRLSID